jgi:alkanesulfonate monooxygenase SsuD/methylene tetrahydromethanopterin reductase-like flavin-dependent oxidoreductase (luciferase family)
MYAMLDQISGGRFELGVGRGFMKYDYLTMGVPFEDAQERLIECLEVVLKAWQQRPFSHHGRYYDFENVSVWPAPFQRPHPPVWGAGTRSAENFAWFGRHGFNLLTVAYILPVPALAELVEAYRAGAREAGHDPGRLQVSTHLQVYCSEDPREAREVGEQALRRYIDQINAARIQGGVEAIPTRALTLEQAVAEGRICVGTPDECAASIEVLQAALGLDSIDCTFYFGGIEYARAQRSLELFAAEVMPRFRGTERRTPSAYADGRLAPAV